MTREEVIAYGKDYYRDLITACCKIDEKHKEFVRMSLKALEQEPKTGHWIRTVNYYIGAYDSIDYTECSCCHEESLEEGSYCPNCGARMEDE